MPMVKFLISVVLAVAPDWQRSIRILAYRIIHNAAAYRSHCKTADRRCSL